MFVCRRPTRFSVCGRGDDWSVVMTDLKVLKLLLREVRGLSLMIRLARPTMDVVLEGVVSEEVKR